MMVRIFKFLCSLKLAVVVLSALTLSLVVATFIESAADTPTAQYYVYRSFWFFGLLGVLGVIILCVALSRLPWKPKHGPFLSAHAGILLVLAGSLITYRAGIDGSIRLKEGHPNALVELSEHRLTIVDAVNPSRLIKSVVVPWLPVWGPEAFRKFHPVAVDVSSDAESAARFMITDYITHAEPRFKFLEGGAEEAPAIELEISSPRMPIKQSYWLWNYGEWKNVKAGPAELAWVNEFDAFKNGPKLEFKIESDSIVYKSASSDADAGKMTLGKIKLGVGAILDPHWRGGVQIKILNWMPHARPETSYVESSVQMGPQAPQPAIRVSNGVQQIWLGLGESASFGNKYLLKFDNRIIELPFSVLLDRFEIERYEGTNDPKSYSSKVRVRQNDHLISMNEPMEQNGFTFYQASFEDAQPRPTISILSVNRDPGRVLKYLGSLLVVLGSIWLFAIKYRAKGAPS